MLLHRGFLGWRQWSSILVLMMAALAGSAISGPEPETLFCPACQARNRAGSMFCLNDGAPLPPVDPARFAAAFTRHPETLSAEEIQTNVREAAASVVRIQIKVSSPIRRPILRGTHGQVRFGQLITVDEMSASGSGFVIGPNGEIVTNAHVASPTGAAGQLTVQTADGRSLPARLIGVDRFSDLALIKVDASGFVPMVWGDSDTLRLGAETWAIGNPLNLGISVTRGTIASKGRTRAGFNQVESFVHSDAYIIGGNSGGPLVDTLGRVVGVSDIRLGSDKGQGYSIASNMARLVIDRLGAHGRYDRGFLGLHVRQVDGEAIQRHALKRTVGVVVESVLPGTVAEKAGFRPGDVLFGINGRQAVSSYLVQEAISSVGPGRALTFTLDRDGAVQDLTVTTTSRPEEPRIDPVRQLEESMMVRFEEDRRQGVVIRIASEFSPSPRYGFYEGSIIESLVPAQDWTEEPLDFFAYRSKARPVKVVTLEDLRGGLRRSYLGGSIGVSFMLKRSKDPVGAVVFDEIWPIVL